MDNQLKTLRTIRTLLQKLMKSMGGENARMLASAYTEIAKVISAITGTEE